MESRVHISVIQKKNTPRLTRCTVCCTNYHCPLCPTSMYKARCRAKVLRHVEVHVNNAIQHEDFFITKCHQACRSGSSGHFHCPFCLKTTIKRQDTLRHLQICRPRLHDAQLDADEEDITSQTEECKAGSVNVPHLSNENLPVSVHDSEMQGPGDPSGRPQDPSPESVLLFSPRLDNPPYRVPCAKLPNVLCPHCNVQLLRKNLKKHLYRKHSDEAVGDIAANSHADVDERDNKDAVKKSFLGPLLSLHLEKESWGKGQEIKSEPSECQIDELGMAAALSPPSHARAYPTVHISVIKKNNTPRLTRCTVCCTNYHCPLCPTSMYKARCRAKVLRHVEVHVKNAIQHEDFFITKCHQACRSGSSGHFHCPFCLKTTIKRQDTMRHLQICRPRLHDAQLDADAVCKEEDITSQTEECKAGSVNVPHLSNENLPVSVHDSEMQGPGDPSGRPQDPSPESVLLFSPRLDNPPYRVPCAKLPNVLCPHCNVQLLRKNLKKHLYRKHSDEAVGDITANSHADVDERDNKDAVKKSFLGTLLPLHLEKESWGEGQEIKSEPSECQIDELGMAAALSPPSHARAYPTVHISVIKKNNTPRLTRCTVCCTNYHCPLCPTSMYKARCRAKVLRHVEVHVKNAIQHEDFFITKCHQACRSGSSGHFHCPFCLKTTIKRQDTLRHLQICRPRLHDAQLDADAVCKEEDITSQTEECKAGSVNVPHLSNENLPVSVHDSEMQGPGDPSGRPQDPSPESVLLFSPRLDNPPYRVPCAKLPNVLCPHCNVQLLRKNLKKHLYRKHSDEAVGDITANSHADVDERDNKDAVKKSFLGTLLPLHLEKESWGEGQEIKSEPSECQIDELGMAAALSPPSHARAYPTVHISVIKKNNTPRLTRCTVCCTNYHCPLCPTSMYKARCRAKVLRHVEVHVKNAIQHEDFFITKCHQACRSGSSGHFHCPFCLKTTIKRQDTLRHLQICRPRLHDAQLDADAVCKEEDITSQTEECEAGSVNLPHLSNDKQPVSSQVHDSEMQGPGDPTERPQDPSPDSALLFSPRLDSPPCRVPRGKLPNVLCPHCNVQLLRKNLKMHIYRKHRKHDRHKKYAVFIDERNGVFRRKPGGKGTKSKAGRCIGGATDMQPQWMTSGKKRNVLQTNCAEAPR